METVLTAIEARILGVFIEKELTTPDYYPLSLNGLTNACNQKSNRDPVMQLEESEVLEHVDRLRKIGLAMQSQDAGSRVAKYRHCLRERLYLDDHELAILAELLLRGPQTLGELRSRADRMASFADLEAVESTLQELADKEPPLTIKLPRQPGRKESRYAQLFCGEPEEDEDAPRQADTSNEGSGAEQELRDEIASLRAELEQLRSEFAQFRQQFE